MAKMKPMEGRNGAEKGVKTTRDLAVAIQFNRMLQSAVPSDVASETEHTRQTGWIGIARVWAGAARRFIVIAAIAFWLGGFTFYAGVAVPMGVEVLGTHKAVGFITQRVTYWLNIAGVVALSIFLLNILIGWRISGKHLKRMLLMTWIAMVAIEIELFIMHPFLDRLLTTQPVREILDVDRFDMLHRIYLISSSVQWFFGVLHVWGISLLWGKQKVPATTTP